jgi:uncharacterized delta-60 repeat protein
VLPSESRSKQQTGPRSNKESEVLEVTKVTTFVRAGLLICLGVAASLAFAAAGNLDPAFGNGGKVLSNFGSPLFVADAILQADGKIVVAISNNNSNFALVRYLPNGALDSSFGTSGFAQTSFGSLNSPQSLSLQPDGKIVVAGVLNHNTFAVARFNSNGSLDNTFGTGGQATAGVAGVLTGAVVVIQVDGKIVVSGSAFQSCRRCSPQLAVARFNADGNLDKTFANQGTMAVTSVLVPTIVALNVANNILVEGNGLITQFSSNGSPSSNITPAAIVRTSNSGPSAFLSDGRFIAAESVAEGALRLRDTDTQAFRFTATGNIDSTFSSPLLDFGGTGTNTGDDAKAVAIQPNGQIVIGVTHFSSGFSNEQFALARLNANGSLDSTFGSGGLVTTSVGGVEDLAAVLVQPDGKIVAIGSANNFSDLAVVRYLGN